ncbi:hypothetical protein ACMXYN_05490 [Neptuniibacter sp. PT8_73]|uniref:hypothetical protein n=1 Tax=unclassified Neptuniibacter TaxID=2630693 RepID=UPI0039F65BBE
MKIPFNYPINQPETYKVDSSKAELNQIHSVFDPKELQILSAEEEQKIRYEQATIRQSTVIEYNGKFIASFAENGWRYFAKSSDFNENYSNSSDTQIIAELTKKYGKSLSITNYPLGAGPTRAELFERVHGHQLRFIDDHV